MIVAILGCALAQAGDVDVVTLNTWGLPSPITPDRAGRLGRAESWIDGLQADVVGLEEVWRGARPFLVSLPGLHLPDATADSGLGLVTPHEVEGLGVRSYRSARGLDALKSKGLLQATVQLADGPVAVFVTHLQAGRSANDAAVRADQVDQLLAQVSRVGLPAIIMGDFNLYDKQPDDDATAQQLIDAGLVDAAATAGVIEPTYPGYPDRYDRIYVLDSDTSHWTVIGAQVIGYDKDPDTPAPDRVSDHSPVTAKLHLGAKPEPVTAWAGLKLPDR